MAGKLGRPPLNPAATGEADAGAYGHHRPGPREGAFIGAGWTVRPWATLAKSEQKLVELVFNHAEKDWRAAAKTSKKRITLCMVFAPD